MDTNEHSGCVRTKASVLVPAWVLGALGAALIGSQTRPTTHYGGYYGDLELLFVINCGLLGWAILFSLVGVVALLSGSRLGRSFSFAFTILSANVITGVVFSFSDFFDMEARADMCTLIWSGSIFVLGAVGGVVVFKIIREFADLARRGALISMAITAGFLILLVLLFALGRERYVILAFVTIFAFLGSVPGAIIGAICERR